MLLELARSLLEEAEIDESNPIPVVLPLSSWAIQRKSITDWIADQLKTQYGMPPQLALDWVSDQVIVPLFDGLDEVSEEHRNQCANAINEYLRENSLTSSALCCRKVEYNLLRQRPDFYGVLTIQPLTRPQVESYVNGGGLGLEGLRTALVADPGLWELAESPLLLSIMALAYRRGQGAINVSSLPDRRQNLYDHYVRTMLHRRAHLLYSPRQSVKYLAVLAKGLERDNQTVFTLDLLNDQWRDASRNTSNLYTKIVASLVCGLTLFVAGWGLLGWKAGIIAGFFSATFTALALACNSYDDLSFISSFVHKGSRLPAPDRSFSGGIADWIIGVAGSVVLESVDSPWQFFGMLILVACTGVAIGVLQSAKIAFAYALALFFAALVAIGVAINAMLVGFIRRTISPTQREVPSPLLRARLHMATWAAIVAGAVCGIIADLSARTPSPMLARTRFGVLVGLFGAALVLTLVAGAPIVEQLITRWRLMRDGDVPWPYLPFLDFMVQCLLLRSVGADYIFVHRELQEFVASRQPEWDTLDSGEHGD